MDRERELETIARAKAGDEAAWRELLRVHRGAILLWAWRAKMSGRDRDDGISIGQETLIRCVRQFKPERGLRLVTMLWLALGRAVPLAFRPGPIKVPRASRGPAPLAPVCVELTHRIPARDSTEGPDLELLESLLESLPDRLRWLMRGRLEGRSFEELGAALGVKDQTARQLAREAIKLMREAAGRRR